LVLISDRLVEVYSKTDVAALAIQSALHDQFEKPIKEIIRIETEQSSQERKLCTCTLSSTLEQVLEELSANRVRRAVIIDAEKHVLGIVSMSDILKFLLI
jgi:5'-AMP-activated protein kinase regulatory gamma subunit